MCSIAVMIQRICTTRVYAAYLRQSVRRVGSALAARSQRPTIEIRMIT